jgi:putative SOS response-associated peptidase YedK
MRVMCNLYSLNKGQDHLRQFFKVARDETGNMPPLPGIFPDSMAPVIRADGPAGNGAAGRVMAMMRWGMPTPSKYLTGDIDRGVTNVRDSSSPYWRRWLKPEFRCLVPATSFCEPTDKPLPETGKKDWVWFALGEDRPLFAFAGIWCTWHGTRGSKVSLITAEHRLYGFLTTEPNGVVRPIHSAAMPVILTTPEDCDAWLTAPVEEALKLQRPLPDAWLRIVGTGKE